MDAQRVVSDLRELAARTSTPDGAWLLLAEGHLTRHLAAAMLHRIWASPVQTG